MDTSDSGSVPGRSSLCMVSLRDSWVKAVLLLP